MLRIIGSGFLILFVSLAPAASRPVAADPLKFEVYEDSAKEFRWRLKEGNDIIATAGQGYKEKSSCKQAIESIKKGLESGKDKFEVYEDNAEAFRWRLKASNGQIVAAANKGYKDKAECEKVVDLIKKEAIKAEIVEVK